MIFLLLLLLSLVSGQKGGAKGAMRGRGKVQSAFESSNVLTSYFSPTTPLYFNLFASAISGGWQRQRRRNQRQGYGGRCEFSSTFVSFSQH